MTPYRPEIPHDWSLVPAAMKAAIDGCRSGALPWPLTLAGPVGCGKTCAALCMWDEVTDGTRIFRTVTDLADKFHHAKMTDAGEVLVMWEYLTAAKLVVLDDLGARSPSEMTNEMVLSLLMRRIARPTVVTTNLTSLDQITRMYDDRITSRLSAGTVVMPSLAKLPDMRVARSSCRRIARAEAGGDEIEGLVAVRKPGDSVIVQPMTPNPSEAKETTE